MSVSQTRFHWYLDDNLRSILVIAATVFFNSNDSNAASAGLFDAFDLIKERIGQGQLPNPVL